MKITLVLFCILGLSGCSASVLRCGTDGESSYVELVNVPQEISGQARHMQGLCAFSYEEDESG